PAIHRGIHMADPRWPRPLGRRVPSPNGLHVILGRDLSTRDPRHAHLTRAKETSDADRSGLRGRHAVPAGGLVPGPRSDAHATVGTGHHPDLASPRPGPWP